MNPREQDVDILLSGGGTAGSVSPLLAVAEALRAEDPTVHFLFLGTHHGPERAMVEREGIPFQAIPSGKWRRYVSWRNVVDLFRLLTAVVVAWRLLRRHRPRVIVSAGGYVAVPVVWAGWLLGIPSLAHQPDVVSGLANRLIARVATHITVGFSESVEHFPRQKTVVTGNPVRATLLKGSAGRAFHHFGLPPERPLVLCLGGGTGAEFLNTAVAAAAPSLLREASIVQATGAGKGIGGPARPGFIRTSFFGPELPDLLAAAAVVITRAGASTLAELSLLGKTVICIPLPVRQQLANARWFAREDALVLIEQATVTNERLATEVFDLLHDRPRATHLAHRLRSLASPQATAAIVALLRPFCPRLQAL